MPVIQNTSGEQTLAEIQLNDFDPSDYPQLNRLCNDFGFIVISVPAAANQSPPQLQGHIFQLCDDSSYNSNSAQAHNSISPGFDTLTELEQYIDNNMVDLLHDHLFSSIESELHLLSTQLSS